MAENETRRLAGAGSEWEVFVREAETDPLQHVGSVSAPSAEVAREEATDLFAWCATDVWLCPAAETRRYSTRSLGADADPDATDAGDEGRTREP